jgi:alpha-ketoglutarate-dependent taurine dioxygenase
VTHLHNDTVPSIGGDTLWASGYAAYEKLSPAFRKIIDGRTAIYRSAHPYLDRNDPEAGPKYVEREHPLVRVHPATGWKALWVNRAMTVRIVGLDKAESDLILGYLYDVYEKNVDIQVRFKWSPRSSALWDNRYVLACSTFTGIADFLGSLSTTPAGIMKVLSHGMARGLLRWPRSRSRPQG